MSIAASRRAQGVARYTFLIVLALVLTGGAIIFWLLKSRAALDDAAPTVVAAAGPVIRADAGVDELLQHAHQAMADQRLLVPAGNNAFELYLAVLKRDPGNRAAQDALREIFPFAAHAAEQTIDSGDDAEAQREIELLARVDARNYTLTLLQSKLQATRDAAARQQEAQQAGKRETVATARAPALAPPPAPAAPAAVAPAPPSPAAVRATPALTPGEQAIAQLQVESTSVEAAPRAAVRPKPAAIVDANGTTLPVLTHRVEPAYPVEARRTRRQGWVDVIFTVQPDGKVAGASVADADPKFVFDRAALAAVSRWQFIPGAQDGRPVAAQLRQRIEFRL
ncbi:energy transducer TonB [Dyella solisilvae]|uniref:Protein TonB n=1 Tax=Dyella solisilvae TaxID=1920168 RepID=A0A370K8V4_9GAMM|nr:energy transducer TonB [Dyella solisilvae]RDI99072.1 energy transducer TonB [Dyella solisilvae]